MPRARARLATMTSVAAMAAMALTRCGAAAQVEAAGGDLRSACRRSVSRWLLGCMTKKATLAFVPFLLCHCLAAQVPALEATKLPVREVTVFKDGHAYLIRDTALPEGTAQVVIEELPAPV